MSKKKRFGLSEALTRGLTETIHVVENNAGLFRNTVLPLTRIELDPENPRKLMIDLFDVKEGIRPEDPLYQQKCDELDKLKELAHTIKSSGVINPVVVYKQGEFYRIVAGERRCLASILAGKKDIEARVFNEKPQAFELKLIQWIENTAREDLSLDERLGNIREIIHAYQRQHGLKEISATILKNITGLSLPQSTYYLAVIHAPQDVQREIQQGTIRNLDKAALIAGVASPELRRSVLEACINGSSLKELRHMVNQQKMIHKAKMNLSPRHPGYLTAKINMGLTSKSEVVKIIVERVIMHDDFARYRDIFSHINWMDLRQATKAFRKLVEILELDTTEYTHG